MNRNTKRSGGRPSCSRRNGVGALGGPHGQRNGLYRHRRHRGDDLGRERARTPHLVEEVECAVPFCGKAVDFPEPQADAPPCAGRRRLRWWRRRAGNWSALTQYSESRNCETVPHLAVGRRAAAREVVVGYRHRLGRETGGVQRDTHPAGRFAHAEFGREVSDDVPASSQVAGRSPARVVVRATTRHRDLALESVAPRDRRRATADSAPRQRHRDRERPSRGPARALQSSTCQREIARSGAPVNGAVSHSSNARPPSGPNGLGGGAAVGRPVDERSPVRRPHHRRELESGRRGREAVRQRPLVTMARPFERGPMRVRTARRGAARHRACNGGDPPRASRDARVRRCRNR